MAMLDRVASQNEQMSKICERYSYDKYIVPLLGMAVPFSIDADTFDAMLNLTQGNGKTSFQSFKLPYPVCFFEVETPFTLTSGEETGEPDYVFSKIGYLIVDVKNLEGLDPDIDQGEDRIIVFHILSNKTGIYFDGVHSQVVEEGIQVQCLNKAEVVEEWEQKTCVNLTSAIIDAIYCINCKDLVQIKEKKFIKLQSKKKLKKNQPELKKTSRVVLKLSREEIRNINARGEGFSRRSHLRRGHFRNLPDKTIWVRNCVVGSGDKIKQSYSVEK